MVIAEFKSISALIRAALIYFGAIIFTVSIRAALIREISRSRRRSSAEFPAGVSRSVLLSSAGKR